MIGLPLDVSTVETSPVVDLSSRLAEVHETVSTCLEDLDAWGEHARQVLTPWVTLARADKLRHQMRASVWQAAQLRAEVRDLEQRPGVPRIAIPPVTLAVATASSSLHAALHALSPAASALSRGDQLQVTVQTSLTAALRFLRVTRSALSDAVRLLHLTEPASEDDPGATKSRPHLSLVPGSDITCKEERPP